MSERHFLFITPQNVRFGRTSPKDDPKVQKGVTMTFLYDAKDAPWLVPELELGLWMTVEEARSLAQALIRTADGAEN